MDDAHTTFKVLPKTNGLDKANVSALYKHLLAKAASSKKAATKIDL